MVSQPHVAKHAFSFLPLLLFYVLHMLTWSVLKNLNTTATLTQCFEPSVASRIVIRRSSGCVKLLDSQLAILEQG